MSQHASSHLAEPKGPGVAEGLAPLVATEPSAVESAQKPDSAASREWGSDHPIDIRFTLPALFGRYYLTIVGGKERRSTDRLAEERFKHPLDKGGNNIFLFLAGAVFSLSCLAVLQAFTAFLMDGGGSLTLP